LTEFLAGPRGAPWHRTLLWTASLLTLASLLTYVAAQMQAVGSAFQHAFGAQPQLGIVLGAAVTVGYTLMGGFLAASITDTLQGFVMVLVAVVVPVAAILHRGGDDAGLVAVLGAVDSPGYQSLFGAREGAAASALAIPVSRTPSISSWAWRRMRR
jgi:Na+/proline symporter